MKYIKNGKVMLDGTIKECDLEEKLLRALEIIVDKQVNIEYIKCCDIYEQYKVICSYWNEITRADFNLLKEITQ